ncbi:hypothetical protein SAMN02799620_03811, partial [Mycolicibacterium fluoranthenivorans]
DGAGSTECGQRGIGESLSQRHRPRTGTGPVTVRKPVHPTHGERHRDDQREADLPPPTDTAPRPVTRQKIPHDHSPHIRSPARQLRRASARCSREPTPKPNGDLAHSNYLGDPARYCAAHTHPSRTRKIPVQPRWRTLTYTRLECQSRKSSGYRATFHAQSSGISPTRAAMHGATDRGEARSHRSVGELAHGDGVPLIGLLTAVAKNGHPVCRM